MWPVFVSAIFHATQYLGTTCSCGYIKPVNSSCQLSRFDATFSVNGSLSNLNGKLLSFPTSTFTNLQFSRTSLFFAEMVTVVDLNFHDFEICLALEKHCCLQHVNGIKHDDQIESYVRGAADRQHLNSAIHPTSHAETN
jgi:hypothetical protein